MYCVDPLFSLHRSCLEGTEEGGLNASLISSSFTRPSRTLSLDWSWPSFPRTRTQPTNRLIRRYYGASEPPTHSRESDRCAWFILPACDNLAYLSPFLSRSRSGTWSFTHHFKYAPIESLTPCFLTTNLDQDLYALIIHYNLRELLPGLHI